MANWLKKPNIDQLRHKAKEEREKQSEQASQALKSFLALTQQLDPHIRRILTDVGNTIITGGGWVISENTQMFSVYMDYQNPKWHPVTTFAEAETASRRWSIVTKKIVVPHDERTPRPVLTMYSVIADFYRDYNDNLQWSGEISEGPGTRAGGKLKGIRSAFYGKGVRIGTKEPLPIDIATIDFQDSIAILQQSIRNTIESGQVPMYVRHNPLFSRPYWTIQTVSGDEGVSE